MRPLYLPAGDWSASFQPGQLGGPSASSFLSPTRAGRRAMCRCMSQSHRSASRLRRVSQWLGQRAVRAGWASAAWFGLICVAGCAAKVGDVAPAAGAEGAAPPLPKTAKRGGRRPTAAESQVLPFDPAVQVGRLENGFTYYLRRHTRPEGRALLWLAVDAGSVLEEPEQRGVAHFVQHMAFNGTARFANSTLVDFIERAGGSFGADKNAFTAFDQTVYMLNVPTGDSGFIFQGLDILEDWASAVEFAPEAVERERGVVLEELRLGRAAGQRVFDQQWPAMLKGSRYAERRPVGEKEVLERVEASVLESFYRKWYRPDTLAVMAVGDFDVEQVRSEIEKRFGGLQAPPGAPPRTSFPVPLLKGTRALVIADPEVAATRVSLAVKGPLAPHRTQGDHRAQLVSELFHGMLRQRLAELSKLPESAFAASFNYTVAMGRAVDVLQLTAVAKQGQGASALARLMLELRRAGEHGFAQSEFDRARRNLERSLQRGVAEAERISSRQYAAELLHHHFDGQALLGAESALSLSRPLLASITREEVYELANSWLQQKDRVLVAIGPQHNALPQEGDLLATVADAEAQAVEPYREAVASMALLRTLPSPGTIVDKRVLPVVDAVEYELSNGVVVAFKRTAHERGRLRLQAVSPGGHSLVGEGRYPSAKLAAAIVGAAGAGAHSLEALQRILIGKAVALAPTLDEFEEGFSGQAAAVDAEALFQLIYLYSTEPRRDPRAFELWKKAQRQALREREPTRAFFQQLIARAYDNHPRRLPLDLELLERVRLDDALATYRERFADASDFKYVVVGDIEPARLEPLLENYLAGLPSQGRQEQFRDVGARGRSGQTQVHLQQGQDPKAFLLLNFHGQDQWEPQAEYDLGALADFLALRMRRVLGEETGEVHGAFAIGSFDRRPVDEYSLTLGFGCEPQQVQSLRARLLKLVEAAKRPGSGYDGLEKIKAQRRRALEAQLEDNVFWLEQLVAHYRFGNILESPGAMLGRVERIEAASLRRAANRFLNEEQYVDGLLMPTQ